MRTKILEMSSLFVALMVFGQVQLPAEDFQIIQGPKELGGVKRMAISPDGKLVAASNAGYKEASSGLWDLKTQKLIIDLQLTLGPVFFTPDSKQLLTQDWDILSLWNIASRDVAISIPVPTDGGIGTMAISPDGATLAACTQTYSSSKELKIFLFDAKTGRQKMTLSGEPKYEIDQMAISPDGQWLVTSQTPIDGPAERKFIGQASKGAGTPKALTRESKRTLTLWNLKTEKQHAVVKSSVNERNGDALFLDDGKKLAFRDQDGKLVLWDVEKNAPARSAKTGPAANQVAETFAISADGKKAAQFTYREPVQVVAFPSGKVLKEIPLPEAEIFLSVCALQFSPDGKTLNILLTDNAVQVCPLEK